MSKLKVSENFVAVIRYKQMPGWRAVAVQEKLDPTADEETGNRGRNLATMQKVNGRHKKSLQPKMQTEIRKIPKNKTRNQTHTRTDRIQEMGKTMKHRCEI